MTTPNTGQSTTRLSALATRFVLGSLLIAAAALAWQGAGVAAGLADVHAQAATLQPAAGTTRFRWLAPLASWLDRDVDRHAATAQYWTRDYRSLTETAGGDLAAGSETMLTSANAAFRRAQADANGGPLSPERLDQVLQAYAAALKNSGFDRDAAYNYEYVARLRDAAGRAKPGTAKPADADHARRAGPFRPSRPGDLPAGPTVHGRPGTHPPATRGEEFEVLTPMDFGDREAQPEPTPGVKMPKKG